MASLTGQLVAETYKALLKTIDNDILTASEKQITDGLGGGSNVFIDSQGFLRANKYKVTNGLATQFLKADGSLDANTYLTGITSSQIITALGYTPVTNARTLTINGTTYDLSANRSWTIAGTSAVWGNITGTLSNQTDLQNALNAKYNNPTGTISQYIRGDGTLATFPTLPGGLPTGGTAGQILAKIDTTDYNAHWIDNFATQTKNEVKLGQTLGKGAAVYVSSANGTNMIVSAASNASEATSSKTLGLLETGGVTNDLVKCVTFGLLAGLDTSTATAGDPVWLGVNGALIFGLANKPYAPAHLVYIGVVTRVQSNNGEIFVNVQNGFELKEIHDVYIADPANNNGLFYDSADGLWKNKSIASALGYTPQAQLNGTGFVKASGTTISYDNSTYLTTADAASTYLALTGGTLTGSITATSFVKTGGTSNEYLRADGSVNVITGDIISGSGTAGYIAKFGSSAVIASSNLFESGANIGFGTITLNYGSYGRAFTGAGFGSTSFGFEAVTGSTTNGGLIGGLSMVIAGNDSTRRIGSAIQSYISGATSTHQGADLRFFVKPDNAVLLEVVRMTSAGITFNKDLTAANITATTFVKSGGLSTQFLMADGSVSTLSSPVTGSGSAGYIPKWTTAANIGSSIIYEDISIGIAYTTPNRGGYGRTLSGAAFGSASFGFEAVSNTTTNGGLIGGLSFIVNQNDSSRIVGSAIQSNLVGTTATNYGADLRFFAKADGVFTIAEVARMTSAGLRVYGTIIKDGGTASQFLKADGSIDSNTYLTSSSAIDWSNIASKPTTLSGYGITDAVNAIYGINTPMTTTGDWIAMSTTSGISGWTHVLNMAWSRISQANWVSQLAFAAQTGTGAYYRTTSGGIVDVGWTRLLDDANFGSYALPLSGGTMTGTIYNNASASIYNYRAQHDGTSGVWRGIIGSYNATANIGTFIGNYLGKSGIFGHNNAMGAWETLRINSLGGNGMGKVILSNNTVVNALDSDTEYPIIHSNNISTYAVVNRSQSNWTVGNLVIDNVVGLLAWKNYGNGHVIFDASNATSPSGTSVSRRDSAEAWTSQYPTLMGWNGSTTFGVRVDSARIADSASSVAWGNVTSKPDAIFYYQGFTLDANTMDTNASGFTYAVNAPYTGPIMRVGNGNYSLQINASYSGGGSQFAVRTRNGDAGTFNPWRTLLNDSNYTAYSPTLTGSGASGSWAISVTGSSSTVSHFSGRTDSAAYNVVWAAGNPSHLYSCDSVTIQSSTGTLSASTLVAGAVVNIGNNSGNNVGAGIYHSSSYYGRIRFYNDGTNNSTIHAFGSSWVGGSSSGYINIDGQNGVNFGGWDAPDVNIARNGITSLFKEVYAYGRGSVNGSAGVGFQIYTPTGSGTGAIMAFHRAGVFAVNFGLDSDNVMRIGGWSAAANRWQLDMSGNQTVAGSSTATSFFESSDMRLKTLIDDSAQISGIENLQAKLYEKDGKIEFGYFAQDAQELMPYAVTTNMDGFLNLSYREVHTAKIARLEQRVAELEKQLNLN
jgi:hypothetical protein